MTPPGGKPHPPPVITVAGCGAIGSVLAARLLRSGAEVQALQRAGAQLQALRSRGIVVEGGPEAADAKLPLRAASDSPSALAPSALVLVCVKSYQTPSLRPLEQLLLPHSRILTLQNGLGNAEWLAEAFGADRVCAGAISYGAHQLAPGVVRWGGEGEIVFGPWRTGGDVEWIADLLRRAGLRASAVADPRPTLWTKLAVNAMINPLSALLRVPNGQLRERPAALELMRRIGAEAVAAATQAGVALPPDDLWARLLRTLEATATNHSSMLQDVDAGRRTELEAITGPILRSTQAPATAALHALIAAMDPGPEGTGC